MTTAAATASFDAEWADVCAGRILEDIAVVDERLLDGIAVSSGLLLLADSYDCLNNDVGVPPGVDAAAYYALIDTCSQFASDASMLWGSNSMEAEAKYQAVRVHTPELLDMISLGTGKTYEIS